MAYPDGPSGSEQANDWIKRTFGKSFGQDFAPIGEAIGKAFKPWSNTGSINWDGPSNGHPLGLINYRGPENKQAIAPRGNSSSTAPSNPRYVDDARDKAMAGRQGMGPNSMPPEDTSEQDLFDQLLGKSNASWTGLDKSKLDYSPLDKALEARIGMLNNLRTQTQGNFDKSDTNLESMHRGLQEDLRGRGAGVYNGIADTEQGNLRGIQDGAQGRLQGIKDSDMAKRTEMLKALGIEAAGGQADSSAATLTDAQANIASRGQAEQVNSEADRTSNLAYNQGIVSSVGQQGVERRGALAQQLQQVLGKLGQAETEYRSNDQEARMNYEQNAEKNQYDEFNNERSWARDGVNRMEDRQDAANAAAAKSGGAQKVAGYSGLAQDLSNTGYDPGSIQNAMGALSKILGSEYMKDINPNAGYSQTAIITRKLQEEYGIDGNLAIQLATNYGNLGTSNSY